MRHLMRERAYSRQRLRDAITANRKARAELSIANAQRTNQGKALAACRDARRALVETTHREHVAMLRRERDYWRESA